MDLAPQLNVTQLNSTFQILIEGSLFLLKSQRNAYISWIFVGFINIISAFFTLIIFITWKPLRTDTQFLAANLAISEIGISFSTMGPAVYHLYNEYFELHEVQSQTTCFGKIIVQYSFLLLLAAFHAVISFDRFMGAIFPLFYSQRNQYYAPIAATCIWFTSICTTISLSYGISNDVLVTACMGRFAITPSANFIYTYFLIALSIIPIFVYICCMMVLRIQISIADLTNESVVEISNRMKNKVTKSLAISASIHLISYLGSVLASLLVGLYSNNAAVLHPYFVTLFLDGGLSSFVVYYFCQQQFRDGLHHIIRKIVKKNNSVGDIVDVEQNLARAKKENFVSSQMHELNDIIR